MSNLETRVATMETQISGILFAMPGMLSISLYTVVHIVINTIVHTVVQNVNHGSTYCTYNTYNT